MEILAALKEEKMIDSFPFEDLQRTPLHKQEPCAWCGKSWYLSEGKLRYHQQERTKTSRWKFPTSCSECRTVSKMRALEARKSNCPSNKKEFDSKTDAETFQRLNQQKFGGEEQFPYYCPQCHNYHLASKKPVEAISSGPLASPLGNIVQQELEKAKTRGKQGETRTEVARLLALGNSTAEIASRLNMTQANVLYHKRNIEGTPTTKPSVLDVEALDADDLDATAERLRLQLEEIQRKKARLEEAKMLRVELVNGAIKIVKEGEHMLLPFGERDKLVLLLTQLSSAATT
jgi:hypothetical protein